MANEIDQDALAAEWGVALEAEHDGAAVSAAATAAGNDVVPAEPDGAVGAEAMAAQWASMVDDGHSCKGGAERILTQEEIDSLLGFSLADVSLNDNSGIRAIIDSAMVSYERLPMLEIIFDRAGPVDDHVAAQLHLRQCRSVARSHHLGALRRLPQFHSAARHPRRVQGRGVGEFRAHHHRLQSDLFDH
jgi:hypothetical protein